MFRVFVKYNKLIVLLLSINLGIIFADENKCSSIEHCEKCPDQNKCETCENGYTLNSEQTKCIQATSNNSNQNNSNSSKNSSSSKKSSTGSAQNTPSGSSKKSSQTSSTSSKKSSTSISSKKSSSSQTNAVQSGSAKDSKHSSVQKASNAPVASNKPVSSAFNLFKDEETNNKGFIYKIILGLIIFVGLICGIRWFINKKKKNKVGYFYDESGNQERAKVVYIQ